MNREQRRMDTTDTATIDYQARFDQLQTRFIDEPREAVREASTLVREAVDRLFNGEQDTEQLRRVMQGYRDLLARIDGQVGGVRSSMATADSSRPAANSEPTDRNVTDRAETDRDRHEVDAETREA
jgi:hypothetical protein